MLFVLFRIHKGLKSFLEIRIRNTKSDVPASLKILLQSVSTYIIEYKLALTNFGGCPQYAIDTMVYHYAIATSIPESRSAALKSNERPLLCLGLQKYMVLSRSMVYMIKWLT